jgi:hypothetical protein
MAIKGLINFLFLIKKKKLTNLRLQGCCHEKPKLVFKNQRLALTNFGKFFGFISLILVHPPPNTLPFIFEFNF